MGTGGADGKVAGNPGLLRADVADNMARSGATVDDVSGRRHCYDPTSAANSGVAGSLHAGFRFDTFVDTVIS